MTAEEFVATLARIDVPLAEANEILGVHYTSVYRWARGEQAVPSYIEKALANLVRLKACEHRSEELVAMQLATPAPAQPDLTIMAMFQQIQSERDDYRSERDKYRDEYRRCRVSVRQAADALGVGDTEITAGVLAMEI